ncbi:MAG: cyclopropane-fatty-acyl-phospholipid synthase family protein [Planctomycetota bacterium]
MGAGEAFAKGYWSSPDPSDVVRLLLRNQVVLQGMERGVARLSKPLLGLYHRLRRNTESGSKANIQAHYDLSNDFFRLFLDPTMMYSCGIFGDAEASLEQASLAKLERIARKLDLQPGDHLLEIGTGWGSMAMYAAREYGCRVTTTTISEQQYALARERVREAGLEGRIEVRREDYRRLTGQFDKLVSIEMIEAVGHQYFDEFFRTCMGLLKPDGVFCLQAITIADAYYDQARRNVDFIKRYIFPGCCIPSVGALSRSIARASDFQSLHLEDIGLHYAPTLRHWSDNLL